MAKGVNKVMLLGNVGKDPEVRSTAGGMQVASFSLATADRAKDAQGNWGDKAEWHNLVCFDKLAETAKNYVKKGSQLFVEGKITSRSWDDKETGQKKYRTEIIVSDFTFVSSKPAGEGGGSSYAGSSSGSGSYSNQGSSAYNKPQSPSGGYDQRQPASTPDYGDNGITDDDIPF